MALRKNIFYVILCVLMCFNILQATSIGLQFNRLQSDSLITETENNRVLSSLDLLVLYQEAIKEQRQDSVAIFKNLALLNAKLNQPKDAKIYTEKYINNSLDLNIVNDSAFDVIKTTDEYKYLERKYLPRVDLQTFFYFCAALIGFFFFIIINLKKTGNKKAKFFIGSFIGVHSLFILEFVLFMSNIRLDYPHTYRISSTVALLFGPLLYFYIRSITQESNFKIADLLHFMPTVILILFFIPIYSESAPEKLKMMLKIKPSINNQLVFLVKVSSLIFYGFYIRWFLFSKIDVNNMFQGTQVSKWFKNLYSIHIIYVVSYFIYGLFAIFIPGYIASYIYHFQTIVMTLMILYIAYMAFEQPIVFMNELGNENILLTKYQKSGLTPGLSEELREQLIKVLVEDKIYKESNISLDILSDKLNTSRHNTSQIINEHFDMNFFELINKFRIKEAVKILEQDTHGSLNIIDVAYEVGYNNKVTFNKAFKKHTNLTPTAYIQLKSNP